VTVRIPICILLLLLTNWCSAATRIIRFPGAAQTLAGAVDGRYVCGHYVIGTQNVTHGFLFDGRGFRTIDPPDSNFTIPTGVLNRNHQIILVGSFNDKTTNVFHGFIWKDGKYTIYDYPGAALTNLNGIDQSGRIVGSHVGPATADIFERRLASPTIMRLIAFPGAAQTFAGGVDGKLVGGTYFFGDQVDHGFMFDGKNYTSIDPPGSHFTLVNGVLSFGGHTVLVGAFAVDISSPLHGFVYLDGDFFTYDFPGATRTTLDGIDDKGHIVGTQSGPRGTTAFELEP